MIVRSLSLSLSELGAGASFEHITSQFAGKKQVRLKFLRRELLPDI